MITLQVQDGNHDKLEKAKKIAKSFDRHYRSPKSVDQLLFECDFDNEDCDLEFDELLIGPKFELEDQLTTDSSYTFTDVTSISRSGFYEFLKKKLTLYNFILQPRPRRMVKFVRYLSI